jgi:hypothetical protein
METKLKELLSLAQLHQGALPVPSLQPILQQLAQGMRGLTRPLALRVILELLSDSGPGLEAAFLSYLLRSFSISKGWEGRNEGLHGNSSSLHSVNLEQVSLAAGSHGLLSARWQGRLRTLQLLQALPGESCRQNSVKSVLSKQKSCCETFQC